MARQRWWRERALAACLKIGPALRCFWPGQAATGTRADHFSWTRANLVSRAARQKEAALEPSAANVFFVRPPLVAAAAGETPEGADLLATLRLPPILCATLIISPLSPAARPRTHAIFFAVRSGSRVNPRRLRTGGARTAIPAATPQQETPRRLLFERGSTPTSRWQPQGSEQLLPSYPGSVCRPTRVP